MKNIVCLLLLYVFGIEVLAQAKASDTPAFPSVTEVQVEGLVEKPLSISVASLKKRKVVEGKNYTIVSSKGEVKRTIGSYKGVLLKDLLNEAKITMANSKERGKYYVLISATDGYEVLFSWNELYNNKTGDSVYVLFEENSKEIVEDGPFVLICTADTITGPRHVRWVKSIKVAKL
ncbi:molybdopterin-dependent oxidoreductase [Rhodocytophaga aerolata]|uniref:Molybdopterin-dependent oxidoreductase n=1 Tax=Rhodocytophaga aerolata TaxID=455078 RepID=A0ABT8R3N4_9BACT|nr:molybdopterin-dependent oxidoreductase [Rhodocytophaga aerolata]MDO1445255.1 molybdopterin-dependent oxidoreductase [Rhodocytophaga aerolata]